MPTLPCQINEEAIPDDVLGPLVDSTSSAADAIALQQRFARDGYLFLRGVIDAQSIQDARREVFERLIEVDEIAPPAIKGIATGRSRRDELHADRGVFWQSVSEGPRLHRVTHADETARLLSTLFGEPARAHDYVFLRPGVVGRFTFPHYDRPFFSRGSDRVVTAWTAIGSVPTSEGALYVIENSHCFDDLLAEITEIDYDSAQSPQVQLTNDVVGFARSRNARLLTADFGPGDVIVFSMTTMHGTFDNSSPIGRTRLTTDVRWQPAGDPIDARYVGPIPLGTTGAGYGELNGAKPLTEPWHIR